MRAGAAGGGGRGPSGCGAGAWRGIAVTGGHTVGQGETPGLAVDAERRVPFVKLFWGDAEHVPDLFAGSGVVAIVPPVDAALDGFGVERVDWLPGSSTKMSKDQR